MIKKLRIKFVLTAALAVFITLSVLIAAMNVVNFARTAKFADDVLDLLYSSGGKFDNFFGDIVPNGDNATPPPAINGESESGGEISAAGSGGKQDVSAGSGDETKVFANDKSDKNAPPKIPRKNMSEETPYETRFFTVKLVDGELVADVKSIAAITGTEAIEYYNIVAKGKKTRGYEDKYRYLIADGGDFVLFVDCTRGLNTAANFLRTSLIVAACGFAAVVLLLILFSNKAIKPVKEGYERQKRFVTDAGHELKTPLTIISANNELSALMNGESEQTKTIEKQVERMTATVKDMIELSKLDEIEKSVRPETFSLSNAVEDLCGAFGAALSACGRTVQKDIADGIFVSGDEKIIRRAVSVVLENAAKYAERKTEITLKTNKKYACLTVVNDAQGVKSGDLSKCFERFYRSDEARASGKTGSGIGLSIAKTIIDRAGGEISATGLSGGLFKIEIKLKTTKNNT